MPLQVVTQANKQTVNLIAEAPGGLMMEMRRSTTHTHMHAHACAFMYALMLPNGNHINKTHLPEIPQAGRPN